MWQCCVTIVEVETKQWLQCILVSYRPLLAVQKYCCTELRSWRTYVCGIIQTCSGLRAKCPMFLFDFNQIWSLSTGFHEIPRYQIRGNPSCGGRIGTCGQTDVTKLIGSFSLLCKRVWKLYFLLTLCVCNIFESQNNERSFPCTALVLSFCYWDGVCLLRGTDWVFKQFKFTSVLRDVMFVLRNACCFVVTAVPRAEFRGRRYLVSDTCGYSKCTSEWLKTDKPRTMVDCCVALACPSRFFSATDQAAKADTSDFRHCWQSTAFVYYKTVSVFGSILKQWQTTPKNLPRMQCARAIPVTWLGSGSCQPGL